MTLQKNVKSHVLLDFEKNVFSNYGENKLAFHHTGIPIISSTRSLCKFAAFSDDEQRLILSWHQILVQSVACTKDTGNCNFRFIYRATHYMHCAVLLQ